MPTPADHRCHSHPYPVGGIGEVVISSAYMDRNYACPPEEMRQLVSYCETNGLPLVIGSDTNAHHTMWGSTNINSRGAQLLDYIAQVDLHPINRGHRATFVVSNKKEVLDVTFVSSHLLDRIKAWWVDDNESCSDHRYIRTSLSLGPPDPIIYRDRKRTRWDLYKSVLKGLTELDPARACPMSSTEEIEASASRVSDFIHKSYDVACPEKVLKSRRKRVPWWSRELTSLRKEARRLYRVARFGEEEAWAEYKAARNYYSYEMRRRKTASWRRFCESVEEAPVATRLSRILRNDGTIKLGSLDKGDGVYTRTLSETYELLLDQSFPRDPQRVPWEPDHSKVDDESINLMITSSKISNIINSFGPLKAAGKDGIFPALLQHGLAELIPYLVPLMRGCLTFGYIPLKWRESRVVFLPKPGKESYERASAWRPICLTSFLLKTLEKLVDGWVRTPDLVDRLQRHSQYAYMKGVSTEAALHQIVSLVEGALDSGEYCIAVMLDVKGAFNEVRSDTIIRSLRRFGVNEVCVRYIEHMLRTRTTWVTDSTYEIGRVVERGCPQGGVLSPLLWDLVVSEILEKLHHRFPQLYSQGFADDLTTVGRGIDLGTVGSHVQRAVNLVSDWCKEVSLSVNDKLALVLFTNKYKFIAPVIKLDGIPIPYQKQVRYLGVLLDHKLNWGPLCRARALKGMRALAQCRRAIGKTWGLSPKITNWIYKSIIRPAMEYGSLLWAPATKVKSHMAQLQRVQRCAMLGTTGVMSSTPTAALQCLLGLVPVDIRVQQVALRTYHRLAHHGQWKKWAGGDRTRVLKHNKFVEIMASGIDEFQMPCEKLVNPPAERNFETSICSVKDWEDGSVPMNASDVNCFTDGSRMGECSGAAYYFTYNNLAQEAVRCSIPLGWAPTVFQAEIMGIIRASETLTDNTHNYSIVDFFIDSQGAIKALTSPWPVSSLTAEAIEMLNHIGETKKVTLHWIPSHHGFEGNEVADLLAKEGTLTGYLGPQPSIPLSRSTVISSIVNWARLQHTKSWESSKGCLTSKAFLSAPSSGLSSKLLTLNRKNLRSVTQTLTGHCTLNGHLRTMGLVDEAMCLCGRGPETVFHFLGSCHKYCALRSELFGRHELPPEQIVTMSLPDLIQFIIRSGREITSGSEETDKKFGATKHSMDEKNDFIPLHVCHPARHLPVTSSRVICPLTASAASGGVVCPVMTGGLDRWLGVDDDDAGYF
ncbi:Retrovirus-related Pol polyprotein from type-1 retrotransposable element R1 [Folsomia candida]|uniref:Retrovirus-related Pol polyprotein from type-1 retrotransposable element R1 n=1 Tax=Folsomia candida TaxID=158441 RepID=A0A226DPQ5_FOLCA|nr:Retrovirus-related Pol polyprotein from type-1 retrotransposable element R1 [Folsomia candida]